MKHEEIREKFFKECTEEHGRLNLVYRPRKINLMPHDLFEWFRPYLKDELGLSAEKFFTREWGTGFVRAILSDHNGLLELSMEDIYRTMERYADQVRGGELTDDFYKRFQELIYGDLPDSELINELHKLDNKTQTLSQPQKEGREDYIKQLEFMVENGLGWEDMKDDRLEGRDLL